MNNSLIILRNQWLQNCFKKYASEFTSRNSEIFFELHLVWREWLQLSRGACMPAVRVNSFW